jgi:type VI secretion system protein
MSRGLLSRLGSGATSGGHVSGGVHASITAHLRHLLNTRQGDSEAAPDYGVPDFTDYLHNFPGGLSDMQVAIQTAIEKYEPRLNQVSVKPVSLSPHALTLQFEVRARLAASPSDTATFATHVYRGGRVSITS